MRKYYKWVTIFIMILSLQIFAGEDEEKKGLSELLPKFVYAWNNENISELIDLFHTDNPHIKKYKNADEIDKSKIKSKIREDILKSMYRFGKIKKTEIKSYNARKSHFVVQVTYSIKGVISGTF